mgnify:CR=1 FL=1
MKTKQLIQDVARITGEPEGSVRDVIETALLVVLDELSEGNDVKLRGVGTLKVRRRLPQLVVKPGLTPGSQIECSVKGPRVVTFSAAKKAEKAINLREVG